MPPQNEDEIKPNYLSYEFGKFLVDSADGDEIVITGLSGSFPESGNVHEFRDNLFEKVDMVTDIETRWKNTHPEMPRRTGKIPDIEEFDAGFFGIHYRQSRSMDPCLRICLERTLETILDAGINPKELEGSRTGVFIGSCYVEAEPYWFGTNVLPQYSAITGLERSMVPNRISYYFKLNGPSETVDTACSSSLFALEHAYKAIRTGTCDSAIVGGVNLCLDPLVTLQFYKLGVLSEDGSCKSFDHAGDGYARSDAVSCVFLQKASQARRIYAKIKHIKTNCDGFKEQGITFPSKESQKNLYLEFYKECKVNVEDLSFIEAHGTGTIVGDPEELLAIDEIFCENRSRQLLLGSVKSNIGHTEATAGICSIVKLIIGMENGLIPPNIHFNTPRKEVEALKNGRLRVVTDKIPFDDSNGLMGINSFGFGGANCHCLIQWNEKLKVNRGLPNDNLPRLVVASGRLEENIKHLFDNLKFDVEFVQLLHQVFRINIDNHLHRGYAIITKTGEIRRNIQILQQTSTPEVLLELTGFKIHWSRVASELSVIPKFADLCNLVQKLSSKTSNVKSLDDVGNFALLCALIDILRTIDFPISGHIPGSVVGEIAWEYFEGKISLEEGVERVMDGSSSKQIFNGNSYQIDEQKIILEIGSMNTSSSNYLSFDGVVDENAFSILLDVLGKLYLYGINFNVDKLYPFVELPVSRSTPMISPLIKWDHSRTWQIESSINSKLYSNSAKTLTLNPNDETFSFMFNHVIDGRDLLPATGYLFFIWEFLSVINGRQMEDMSVVFENCRFLRASNLSRDSNTDFILMIQRKSGIFELIEKDTLVVSGSIKIVAEPDQLILPDLKGVPEKEAIKMKTRDIYKELRLRGYGYKGCFRKLLEVDVSASKGLVQWENNWVTFMDNMLQMKILQEDTRLLYVPTTIKYLSINPRAHLNYMETFGEEPQVPVYIYKDSGVIKSGGIEIRGLSATSIGKRKPRSDPVLESYQFIANNSELSLQETLRVNIQIILENAPNINVKVVEELKESQSDPLSEQLIEILGDIPLIRAEIVLLTDQEIEIPGVTIENSQLSTVVDCNIAIVRGALKSTVQLSQVFCSLKENGFIISRESKDLELTNIVEGVDIVTSFRTSDELIVLIKKQTTCKVSTILNISNNVDDFLWIDHLKKSLQNNESIIIVAQHDILNGILGFVNCIQREPGGREVRGVLILDEDAPEFDPKSPFYSNQLKKNLVINVYKNHEWGTYRHLILNRELLVEREQSFVNTTLKGDLSSLKWLEGNLTRDTINDPEEELVHVYYSALNFRDIMTATGRLQADVITRDRSMQECLQGLEFSGRTNDGTRVMGMTVTGAMSTLLSTDKYLLWNIPDHWSLEDAATVPVVYGTVLYAFFLVVNLKKESKILIHAGSGGIGQAAIGIALHYGCTVFTTVGTAEKREFLRKRFPLLKEQHIGNSRDTTFEQMIQEQTNGRGVDLVLNSLAEEKLEASVRCLAYGGKFLEIGKFDLASNRMLQLLFLSKNASYHGIMVDAFFSSEPRQKELIKRLIDRCLAEGAIKPLVREVFKHDEIEQAFRYMANGKHMGKVLVQIREEEDQKVFVPPIKIIKAIPRYSCKRDDVYVILGGLGGFGLELADWLVLRGARKLVLTSRKGITTGYQTYRLRIWQSYGCVVRISKADITLPSGITELLNDANELGKVVAIFNLAVVLKDALFENQNEETFTTSFKPKAYATMHLDRISRVLCPELEDFVIFSSVSCGRGNAGQTNYGMANSVMERLCEKRKSEGLPALAIEWGAVGDVGLVAELQEDDIKLEIGGTLLQSISNCLEMMDYFLRQPNAIVSSMVVAEKRRALGGNNIVNAVANIIGIRDLKTVSQHSTLAEIGMDSMNAVEIKQILEREHDVFLTPQEMRSLTFARLQEIQDEKMNKTNKEEADQPKDKPLVGFEILMRLLSDEDTCNLPIIMMKSALDEKYHQENAMPLILIPGIEGDSQSFIELAGKLNDKVYSLQFGTDRRDSEIGSLVDELEKNILTLLIENEPFKIVAHSFGVILGLEIVARLEKLGYKGTLICIDGSPSMLKLLMMNHFDINDQNALETGLLLQLLSHHIPIEILMTHKEHIYKFEDWTTRCNYCKTLVSQDNPRLMNYIENFTESILQRMIALKNYEVQYDKINTEIFLYKPQANSLSDIAEDYLLSEVCQNTVHIETLSGNHLTILNNIELANSINRIFGLENNSDEGSGREI